MYGARLIDVSDQIYQPSLSQLRAFAAIAEYRHFGLAAQHLGVRQGTLSQALAALEEGLGLQLIERSTRKVYVTAAGVNLVDKAKAVLAAADGFAASAAGVHDHLTGPLRIGLIPTVAPYVLPTFLPALAVEMPAITPHIVEDQTARLVAALRDGTLDVAVVALPLETASLLEMPLYNEDFVLATPAGHELGSLGRVNPSVLDGQALLLLDEGHCLRHQTLDVCRHADAQPQLQDTRAASLSTIVQCVANGLGVTLLPETAVPVESARAELEISSFTEPAPHRTIGLAYRASSPLGDAFAELGRVLADCVPVDALDA
jgi:LysR family hydrogen peroxide-inducible transcriptional activator